MDIKEVPPGGPPWKTNHEGVPSAWKGKGAGGNAHVWLDGQLAIKRLKPNAGKEPVERFTREAMVLSSIDRDAGLAVVPVVEVRRRAGEIEIVMEAFEGNLDEVIVEFSGQPAKAASALLPIVETLTRLAVRAQPIHHRDIKPENILYRRHRGELALALGDFGCAYLAEDDRLTPIHRAIGAWAYRPPEYSIGRVANVDEKGDVFSLGKVFWAMLNGERHVVFPGPVWFLEEFDLARKFATTPKIHHAMIAIAQACEIRPERRPTLAQFSEILRGLVTSSIGDVPVSDELTAAMLRAEALREIAYQQRRSFASQFVRAIHADFLRSIEALCDRTPQSALFNAWLIEYQRAGQKEPALVAQVADHESDAPLVNVFYRKTILNTRFFPANAAEPIRFVVQVVDQTNQVPTSILTISGTDGGARVDCCLANGPGVIGSYQGNTMIDFLMEAARRIP